MEIVEHLPDLSELERSRLDDAIPEWHGEVKSLLPSLTEQLQVEFDNNYLISDYGVGGFASSRTKIKLAFDPGFTGNKEKQLRDLRGSYFHECYHIIQGFVGDESEGEISAIDDAIFEGAATRFESLRADTTPGWGEYPDRETVMSWFKDVTGLPTGYDWNKWKFYDPETGNRWVLYRVGVFVVDEALQKNPKLTIEDLATKSPSEILKLAELT